MEGTKIKAFTLFEVTVVLAIMSILITIVSVSLTRFNEQVKTSADIHQELNHFFVVRSNLWRELYESDSLLCDKGSLFIFKNGFPVEYFIREESLQRKSPAGNEDMKLAAESIQSLEVQGEQMIEITFIWKEETMKLGYLDKARTDVKINRYFDELQ